MKRVCADRKYFFVILRFCAIDDPNKDWFQMSCAKRHNDCMRFVWTISRSIYFTVRINNRHGNHAWQILSDYWSIGTCCKQHIELRCVSMQPDKPFIVLQWRVQEYGPLFTWIELQMKTPKQLVIYVLWLSEFDSNWFCKSTKLAWVNFFGIEGSCSRWRVW